MRAPAPGPARARARARAPCSTDGFPDDPHELAHVTRVRVTQPVESNAVFAVMPRDAVARVQERFFFYVWDEQTSEVRLMCSFDTTEGDVTELAAAIREAVARG